MKHFNSAFKTILAGIGALIVAQAAFASPQTDAMLDKLKKTYPNIPFTEVNETPVSGIFEAVFGKDMLYVEATGTYFFPTMVNMKTKENLGEERRAVLNKIDFKELPLADAIKVVHGNGKRQMAVFADANCGYCKKLENVLAGMTDVTVYTFAIGILGPDSTAKANAVNCSTGDKGKLWTSMVMGGAKPVVNNCSNGITERNAALFKELGFQGTPSIIFGNGAVLKGYAEAPRIEQMLNAK
jgi:thiol:disulfide interchange protein DsbC